VKWISLFFLLVFSSAPVLAQTSEAASSAATSSTTAPEQDSFLFHAQATVVTQGHYPFTSPYEGKNSLISHEDGQTSITNTYFFGYRPASMTEIYFNPELAGGSGLSKTQGIAGFPNGEIYRVDAATPQWNMSRLYIKQVINFDGPTEKVDVGQNQFAASYSVNRLSLVAGKFALNDFFDNNTYSHDPRTQFLNWALMDYGAWDYSADTRGYTWGLMAELNRSSWAARLALTLEPEEANQMDFDMNIEQAHAVNFEFEYRYLTGEYAGTARFLAYDNSAHMGNYREAIDDPSPDKDITKFRSYSHKYGFGLSLEQKLSDSWGLFSRISWNDGKTESWAFTEIDQSFTAGAVYTPNFFKGHVDAMGMAVIVNGISEDHKDYLAAGGYGFLIGDGRLNYSPEKIIETYYMFKVNKEAAITGDYQFVSCPAYNQDRGPVSIFAIRLHYEI
jgi:high affinity Mn2+ porin